MWLKQLRMLGGDVSRGTQIIYVPGHATNLAHPDCETGFVTSVRGDTIFCRYWSKHEEDLRTKANSEGTPVENIFVTNSVPQNLVDEMLEKYCKEG